MRSYPVLDPVSQAYPRVQGRSPTCYSPVRHSSTPERAFPFDLHVLSTPPAFVLSQDQTLQTKTIQRNLTYITKRDKKTTPNHGDGQMRQKNNKQKPPNTLLSSQTTHPFDRSTSPRPWGRALVVRTGGQSTEVGFPLDANALSGLATSRWLHQVTRGTDGSQTAC